MMSKALVKIIEIISYGLILYVFFWLFWIIPALLIVYFNNKNNAEIYSNPHLEKTVFLNEEQCFEKLENLSLCQKIFYRQRKGGSKSLFKKAFTTTFFFKSTCEATLKTTCRNDPMLFIEAVPHGFAAFYQTGNLSKEYKVIPIFNVNNKIITVNGTEILR